MLDRGDVAVKQLYCTFFCELVPPLSLDENSGKPHNSSGLSLVVKSPPTLVSHKVHLNSVIQIPGSNINSKMSHVDPWVRYGRCLFLDWQVLDPSSHFICVGSFSVPSPLHSVSLFQI